MGLRFFIWTALLAILVSCKNIDNDIEVNADIRMNPRLIEDLKQSVDDELEMGYFRGNSDPDYVMESVKDNTLHELLKEDLPEMASGGNALLTKIHTYEGRAQQKGKDCLQAIADHVQTKLNLSKNVVTPIVQKITSDYIAAIKKYFSDLANEKPNCHVDEEYLVLDMVNVVPLIRGNIGENLLHEILFLAQGTPDDEIELITKTLVAFSDNDKRQEMDFMCASFGVCRPNPTFSNYLYKLLEEVLNLKNVKFLYVLTKCSQLLLNKLSLFETVLRDDILALLRTKMNNMASANITEMREAVSFLHSIVTRRYKTNYTKDRRIQNKAKSAYIILDILDTAFGIDGKDLYVPQLEKTISSIREWSTQTRNDLDAELFYLIQYVIEALNYNLNKRAKEEIMILADIIFYNTAGNQNETQYLLTEGSKFVNGLLNRPEPIKLW